MGEEGHVLMQGDVEKVFFFTRKPDFPSDSESEFGFIRHVGLHKHRIDCGRKVHTINI